MAKTGATFVVYVFKGITLGSVTVFRVCNLDHDLRKSRSLGAGTC